MSFPGCGETGGTVPPSARYQEALCKNFDDLEQAAVEHGGFRGVFVVLLGSLHTASF